MWRPRSPELHPLRKHNAKECTPVSAPKEPPQCPTHPRHPSMLAADPKRKDRFLKRMSHPGC
jgi:hypothetical protein